MTAADTAPGPAAVVLRPFGYLIVGIVWVALFLVTLSISGMLLVGLASTGWDTRDFFGDVGVPTFLAVGFIGALWTVLVGFVEVLLPLATAPLAVLSLTYVVRSLRPAYRSHRLSYTVQGRETIGPVTLTGTVALSLLPVRRTRWTDAWMRWYAAGWSGGNRRLWVASMPWGAATFLLPGWVLWPVGPAAAAVWTVLTVAAGVATIIMTWRALTRPGRTTPTESGKVRAALEVLVQGVVFGPSSVRGELRALRREREKRRRGR